MSGESNIMGSRRATSRWVDDPEWRMDMLGLRQAMPRWEEDPVSWLSWGLENQGRRVNRYITISNIV